MAISHEVRRLNVFERYLTLWVALCMLVGIIVGKTLPGITEALRRLEFGGGSQINIPIAVLIWLMIYPMMLKVDFASVLSVGNRTRGWFDAASPEDCPDATPGCCANWRDFVTAEGHSD